MSATPSCEHVLTEPASSVSGNPATTARFFHNLEALRGVCALLVALYHAAWASHIAMLPIVRNGWLFVDFFFVLSGFVMTHTYWRGAARISTADDGREFMVRRFFRLYPTHLIAYLAAFLVVWLGELLRAQGQASAIATMFSLDSLKTLLLLQTIVPTQTTFNTPSWSISAEFWTYLVFAGILVLGRTDRIRLTALVVSGLLGLALLVYGNWPLGLYTALEFGFPRCVAGFALGALVFKAYSTTTWRPATTVVALLLGLTFLAVWALLMSLSDPTPWNVAALPLFAAIIFLAALDPGSIFRRLLETAPARLLGRVSYSLYMLHVAVLSIVSFAVTKLAPRIKGHFAAPAFSGDYFIGDLFCPAYVVAVIAVAIAGYSLVEHPGRLLGNRLTRRKQA